MPPPPKAAGAGASSARPSISVVVLLFYALFTLTTPSRFQPGTFVRRALGAALPARPPRLRHTRAAAAPAAAGAAAGAAAAPAADGSPDVAAIYVFWRRPKAFVQALQHFRAAYPRTHAVLICDAGCYNYSRVAAHFSADYLGEPHGLSMKKHGAFYVGPDEALNVIRAYRAALDIITEPYFMQLEDDVYTVKRITTPLAGHINGIAWDKAIVGGAEEYVRRHVAAADVPEPMVLGGFGGCVYETAYWRRILNLPNIEDEVRDLYTVSANYGVDYIFSSLLYRFGGRMHDWTGYVESFREDLFERLAAGSIEVFHGHKKNYGLRDRDLSFEEYSLLGDAFDGGYTFCERNPTLPDCGRR
jgi:hypothetical protein